MVDLFVDVNGYLDAFRVPEAFDRPITLHDLLTHTAGFEERVVGYAARTAADVEPLGTFLARMLPARGWPPGLVTGYSNLGYALAAHALESAAGVPFDELVTRRILTPLGMTRSGYVRADAGGGDAQRAVGYRCAAVGCARIEPDFRSAYPAGGMVSTASDMALFLLASIGPDTSLTGEYRAELQRRQFTHHPSLLGIAYAYAEGDLAGLRTLSHSGGIPGFSSLLTLVPDAGFGFFVVVNGGSSGFGASVRDLIVAEFLGPADAPSTGENPRPAAASASQAASILGSYRVTRLARRTIENLPTMFAGQLRVVPTWGDTVRVFGLGDGDGRYVPEGEGVWRGIDGGERIAVHRDSYGHITHLFGAASYFGSPFPVAYERLAWYDAPAFVNEALSVLVLPLFLTALLWPLADGVGRAIRRVRRLPRRPPAGPRVPIAVACLFGLLGVLFGFGFIAPTVQAATTGGGDIVYGMPLRLAIVSWVPVILAGIVVPMLWWAVAAWRHRWWSLPGRVCFTGATVAALLSLLLLAHWSYLPALY